MAVKDESDRFGLPSFKMLGASWATYRTLVALLGRRARVVHRRRAGRRAWRRLRPLTLTTATDGNHGRAVAHMAALLGFAARIFVPDDMVPARIEAIEGEGAEVVVVDGTYDEAVAAAAASDGVVVADTGEGEAPAWVIEGYSTMFRELGDRRFDAVFFPVGVGALAAAVVTAFRPGDTVPGRRSGLRRPVPGALPGGGTGDHPARRAPHDHVRDLLRHPVAGRLAARVPRRRLGRDRRRRPGPGRHAGAGRRGDRLGRDRGRRTGRVSSRSSATEAEGPDLGPDSSVLVLSTEGATDPVAYAEIVGRAP